MAAANTDKLTKLGNPGSATSLAAPGHTIGGSTFTVDSTSNWPTDTGVVFSIDTVTLVEGQEVRDADSYTVWEGVVTSATTIGSATLLYGDDQNYPAGSTTRVYIIPTTTRENQIIDALLAEHQQDGSHGAITPTSVVSSGPITGTVGTFASVVISGTATSQGWTALGDVPDTVTANSSVPKVYDLVFNGEDHTDTLSNGMKLQLARTVAAPSQCTDLESSSSQYYSKSSPAGMTFTDDFVVSAWIKLESYVEGTIASRYNGTSGWYLDVTNAGQVRLTGHNAGGGNYRQVLSYASVPLNKWVHVTAQLDMSTYTATTTTCYIMIDGIDVAAQLAQAGTNPTALVQAGDLQVGARNGASNPFDGKIAQVAIYSAKVTQATILASINRTLSGSETSLISAYSFNNSINDLNTSNANNLTAQNSAVATNADSPFANAVSAGSLEYAEVLNVAFSTNTTVTVRVPDGCQIPTSGGISSVLYSTQSNPYGLPEFSGTLGEVLHLTSQAGITSEVDISGATITVYVPANRKIKLRASMNVSASATNSGALRVKEGSTRLTQIQLANTSTSITNFYADIPVYPTTGSHTYKLSFLQGTGGTWAVANDTQTMGYLIAELV